MTLSLLDLAMADRAPASPIDRARERALCETLWKKLQEAQEGMFEFTLPMVDQPGRSVRLELSPHWSKNSEIRVTLDNEEIASILPARVVSLRQTYYLQWSRGVVFPSLLDYLDQILAPLPEAVGVPPVAPSPAPRHSLTTSIPIDETIAKLYEGKHPRDSWNFLVPIEVWQDVTPRVHVGGDRGWRPQPYQQAVCAWADGGGAVWTVWLSDGLPVVTMRRGADPLMVGHISDNALRSAMKRIIKEIP